MFGRRVARLLPSLHWVASEEASLVLALATCVCMSSGAGAIFGLYRCQAPAPYLRLDSFYCLFAAFLPFDLKITIEFYRRVLYHSRCVKIWRPSYPKTDQFR